MPSRPWTPPEDRLVCTLPPGEAAVRTGRDIKAVYRRRLALGVTTGKGRQAPAHAERADRTGPRPGMPHLQARWAKGK